MSDTIFQKDGNKLTIIPKARLDTASAPILKDEITPYLEGTTDLTMDFEQVDYISSAGLRVLLILYQKMDDLDGSFRLIHVRNSILAILKLVNLTAIIDIEQ